MSGVTAAPSPFDVPGLEMALAILNSAESLAELKAKLQSAVVLAQTAPTTAVLASAVETIMSEAQIFASAWAFVDGPFDQGQGMDKANEAKDQLLLVVQRTLSNV